MTNRKGITRRAGSDNWYVRVQVPVEAQKAAGRTEIWRSLQTPDRKTPNRLAPAVTANILRQIEQSVLRAPREPTREELKDLVHQFYLDEVESDLNERMVEPEIVRSNLKRNPHRYRDYQKLLRRDMVEMDYSHVESDADFLLGLEGMTLDHQDPLFAELLQLLMRARIEAARRWSEHDEAIFGEAPSDTYFRDIVARPAAPSSTKPPRKTLLELFDDYGVARRSALKPTTIDDSRKTVIRFSEFVGIVRPVETIDRDLARERRNLLLIWPQYANQVDEFEGLDFKVNRPGFSGDL